MKELIDFFSIVKFLVFKPASFEVMNFLSQVGHSCPNSLPLSRPQTLSACIVTSQQRHFAGGLSIKKAETYYSQAIRHVTIILKTRQIQSQMAEFVEWVLHNIMVVSSIPAKVHF